MNFKIKAVAALSAAGVFALTGCAANGNSGSSADEISVVGYSVLEAANKPIFEDFQKTDEGADVTFQTSYGASGDPRRAVAINLNADVVYFSLETDITRLVDEQAKDILAVERGRPDRLRTSGDRARSPPSRRGSATWAAYSSSSPRS